VPTAPEQHFRGTLVLVLVLAIFAGAAWFWVPRIYDLEHGRHTGTIATNALELLTEFEAQQAAKYWGPELDAENHGRVIDAFWDSINHATNRLGIVEDLPISGISLAAYAPPVVFPHDIQVLNPASETRRLTSAAWKAFVQSARLAGWSLFGCEFRQNSFRPGSANAPARSDYYFSADLANERTGERAMLEGTLGIDWNDSTAGSQAGQIDATKIQIRMRRGQPPFKLVLDQEVAPPEGSYFIDPLIVYDIDGDGQPEIVLAAKNLFFQQKNGRWESRPLCRVNPGIIFSAVVGDFNGDGNLDFLCAKFEGLFLYEGTAGGEFPSEPRQVWAARPHLKYVQTMTIGDIDGDGDLDLFIGQYKPPFNEGQMASPYYDANDGYPSFLLVNDGKGNFTDTTQKAGFGAKRNRRVYSASLADLDGDGDLDLLVISDFAGVDAWENNGRGEFTSETSEWFSESHGFGMGHCLTDLNNDGMLDCLMIGMNSPTVSRLDALGLERPYDKAPAGIRSRMAAGNRVYFGCADGKFREFKTGAPLARTGWSWGAAAGDVDGDGFADIYITNGHDSRESVREYEPEFWLHDIYVGTSQENSLAERYFKAKYARTRGAGESYGGYEKNRFFLNLGGTNFLECAFLMSIDSQADSRNVLIEDLNDDGKLDLVFTTFEAYPTVRQTLKVFENLIPNAPPVATLTTKDSRRTGHVLHLVDGSVDLLGTTESYRSQHPLRVHVPASDVQAIEQLKAQGLVVAPASPIVRTQSN
jgi:hypothetical protein